jgi:hypothetical protein
MTRFAAPIAEQIWDMKYRLKSAEGKALDETVEDTWRRIATDLASVEADPRPGRAVLRGAGGFPLPARGPHRGGRGHGAVGDAVQLLRHGHDPRQHGRHLRGAERGRADHAAGRRDRLRFLHHPAQGRAGLGRGGGCLGAAFLHGCLGRHVPHDHVRGLAPRRDDGDDALRPSRYRGFHRRQGRPAACACST